MKNLLLLIVAAAFITLAPSCQKETVTETVVETDTVTIDLKRGLIAYYPFTGNANDSSGNNKHGQAMNGLTYSTDVHSNANAAASFDGLDDYINIPDAANYFAPPKMSVSFLFNLRDVNTRSAMITKSAFATPSAVSWSTGVSLPNDPHLSLAVGGGNNACSTLWGNGISYNQQYATALQNNRWYHATIVFNLGVQMIYVDGQLVSALVGNTPYLNQCGNADLRMGAWWGSDLVSINGKIDEVRIYNRILAENEIEKLAEERN
jgi:hypothetical protein